ncbi:MAG: tRNA pseudouridine(38-40) synthase TruA [Oligoflexales bacterium]
MEYLYRIDIQYIGRSFTGWQTQPSKDSVQDFLTQALITVLRQQIQVVGASRTDSGVHALGQVATFKTEAPIDVRTAAKSLNAIIPKDMGIKSIVPVDSNFHPILSAKSKLYCYRIWNDVGHNPFVAPYVWPYPFENISAGHLAANVKEYVGEHDFSSFCAADSGAKTRSRRIYDVHVDQKGNLLSIWILGNGFLKQMIRIMVGTLVDISVGKIQSSVSQILSARDRTRAGVTAPAQGLSLVKIFYEDVTKLDRAMMEGGNAIFF